MVEARDMVLVSFPFAAGVALSQFCHFPLFHICLTLSAVLILLALADALPRKPWFALLFLVLGALCGSSGFPVGTGEESGALGAFDTLIRRIPWQDGRSCGLVRALLTGRRDGLSPESISAFRAAGASHILALSGLHLGIIYLFLGRMLKIMGNGRVRHYLRSILLILSCAAYATLTGASPSIIRALLFITINEIAAHCPGRRKSPLAVWCLALMIQLSATPWVIVSVGFQLSYLAMLGIFTIFPAMDGWFPSEGRHDGPVRRIWSSMAMSITCQIYTAPLVWWRFGTFPKYFLLTNLLALPLTSGLMLCAVSCLLLYAFGLTPVWPVRVVEYLSGLLLDTLGIIASIP